MLSRVIAIGALIVSPAVASAQQPCTTDAGRVVDEIYRHVLERGADAESRGWAAQLANGGATVREVVRGVAKSPEHMQRFGNEDGNRAAGHLYRHLLGRQADADGQRGYAELAASRGLAAVVDHIISSREYEQSFGDWGVPGSGGMRYCGSGSQISSNQSGSLQPRFRGMDRNGDGVVERSEWRGNARAFREQDWNGDGILSGDEVQGGARSRSRSRDVVEQDYDPSNQRQFRSWAQEGFAHLDANRDGRIALNEWTLGRQAFRDGDSNGDGWLSSSEVLATDVGRFAAIDTDGDRQISADEWRWSRRSFDRQDSNGDGVINRREFRSEGVATSGTYR